MGLYSDVLNMSSIHHTFFFKVIPISEFESLGALKENKPKLYETWINLSKDTPENQGMSNENYYLRYSPYYPEFSKILAVIYASVGYDENGKLIKNLKRIVYNEETTVLKNFFDVLYQLSTDGNNSTPKDFKTLCGYNIIYNDIPFLIKRFILNRDEMGYDRRMELPLILKNTLDLKPWDSTAVIDLASVWGFKGRDIYSMDLIINFLGLKSPQELLSPHKLSEKYWETFKNDEVEALKTIATQGTIQTNAIISILNKLRGF
jgi:hypothetical protein